MTQGPDIDHLLPPDARYESALLFNDDDAKK
jgi:hypothetical protein